MKISRNIIFLGNFILESQKGLFPCLKRIAGTCRRWRARSAGKSCPVSHCKAIPWQLVCQFSVDHVIYWGPQVPGLRTHLAESRRVVISGKQLLIFRMETDHGNLGEYLPRLCRSYPRGFHRSSFCYILYFLSVCERILFCEIYVQWCKSLTSRKKFKVNVPEKKK